MRKQFSPNSPKTKLRIFSLWQMNFIFFFAVYWINIVLMPIQGQETINTEGKVFDHQLQFWKALVELTLN